MERRDFLRGILVGASAGLATIKLATPEETKALTVNAPALVGHPSRPDVFGLDIWNQLVYLERNGQYEPIGYVSELRMHAPVYDAMHYDGEVQVIQGPPRGTLSFKGPVR